MIHHISIPADDPLRVAKALAAFWRSEVLPFPMYEASYVVFSGDGEGSCIEVYPAHRVLQPASPELPALVEGPVGGLSGFHAALSVPVDEEAIATVCDEQGWLCRRGSRGDFFHVVEVWVENRTLLELLTPEMAAEYRAFASIDNWKRLFGSAANPRQGGVEAQ